MPSISGKVLIAGSSRGVANSIVEFALAPSVSNCKGTRGCEAETPALRLGSVATAADGRFRFVWEKTTFPTSDPVDLIARVRPPIACETQCDHEQATLCSTRIRGVSFIGEEVLLMSVSSDALAKHGLAAAPSETIAQDFEFQWAQDEKMAKFLAPKLREVIKTRDQRSTKVAQLMSNLSAVPAAMRKDVLYVAPGDTFETAQMAAEASGLLKLVDYADAGHAATIIRLRDEVLFDAGINFDDWKDRLVPLPVGYACDLLGHIQKGPALERIRDLTEAFAGTANPVGDTPTPDHPPPAPEGDEDPDAFIRERVLAQIRPLPGHGDNATTKDLFARLRAAVEELEAPRGPSDVTAVHDFHTLQLAFEEVWTAAFDAKFKRTAQDLFHATVKLHEDYDLDGSWMHETEDVEQFQEFIAELDGRISAMEFIPIASEVQRAFAWVTYTQWNALSCSQQRELRELANDVLSRRSDRNYVEGRTALARQIVGNPDGDLGRAQRFIIEARERLREPYQFRYFAPDSVNYGILTTYRQWWEPDAYQVGDLVATIPLAPGESRSITTTQRIRRSRSEREVETALVSQRDEVQARQRIEDEVMRRAATNTNFSTSVRGAINFGIGEIGGTTGFSLDQATQSANAKRMAREAVSSAAQEIRRDHSLHVEVEQAFERDESATSSISNPNNEITVTYLLFELERRYNVRQQLNRVTPVILVAQDMPAPHEIDDDWISAHAWIIKRVLLDDGFRKAIEVLEQHFVGDELGLEVKRAHWQTQQTLVETLKASIEEKSAAVASLQELLIRATENRDLSESARPDDLELAARAFFSGGFSLLFGDGSEPTDRLEAQRNALELRLQQTRDALAESRRELAREVTALETATKRYTEALETQFNRRAQIDQLRVHIKQNILHYMHAIWAHEPPDQRFFRLYRKFVRVPNPPAGGCTIRRATADEEGAHVFWRDGVAYVLECRPPLTGEATRKPLSELAALDSPLGFKGNYIIFPLKECTHLTDFMTLEYVDDYFGVRDPDEFSEFPLDVLMAIRERSPALTPEDRDLLERLIARKLVGPHAGTETIVVPTGQLFMEALRGTQPLLEGFKQAHRALDVAVVEAQLRANTLENLRYAARLVAGEVEDPEVDRNIRVEGGTLRTETDI